MHTAIVWKTIIYENVIGKLLILIPGLTPLFKQHLKNTDVLK